MNLSAVEKGNGSGLWVFYYLVVSALPLVSAASPGVARILLLGAVHQVVKRVGVEIDVVGPGESSRLMGRHTDR